MEGQHKEILLHCSQDRCDIRRDAAPRRVTVRRCWCNFTVSASVELGASELVLSAGPLTKKLTSRSLSQLSAPPPTGKQTPEPLQAQGPALDFKFQMGGHVK